MNVTEFTSYEYEALTKKGLQKINSFHSEKKKIYKKNLFFHQYFC
jgi:hypothetical protein